MTVQVTNLIHIRQFRPLNKHRVPGGSGDLVSAAYTYNLNNKLQSIADEDVSASDADNDGLTRDEEISYGSDPNNADTDNDGLNDNVEVNTYNTYPWKGDNDS